MYSYKFCDYWKSGPYEKSILSRIFSTKLYFIPKILKNFNNFNKSKMNHPILRIVIEEENSNKIFDECLKELSKEPSGNYLYWFCRACFVISKENSYIYINSKLILEQSGDIEIKFINESPYNVRNEMLSESVSKYCHSLHYCILIKDSYIRYIKNIKGRDIWCLDSLKECKEIKEGLDNEDFFKHFFVLVMNFL